MNMIGAPKHVAKCLEVGVDIICAQGSEGEYPPLFISLNTHTHEVITIIQGVGTLGILQLPS